MPIPFDLVNPFGLALFRMWLFICSSTVVFVVIVVGCCLGCCPFLTCPLYLHWLVVASHFVLPPLPLVLVASWSTATSWQIASSASHSPLVCLGCIPSSHAAASWCTDTCSLPRLVVALPILALPLSLLMCYHLSTCHHLPFAWLVVAWFLIALQPYDALLPFDAPPGCCVTSRCTTLMFALAGCSITSHCPAYASQLAIASPCTGATTSHSPLVKNTPSAPGRHFFLAPDASGWVDKDGSNAWFLVGWHAVSHPPIPTTRNWVMNHICASAQN